MARLAEPCILALFCVPHWEWGAGSRVPRAPGGHPAKGRQPVSREVGLFLKLPSASQIAQRASLASGAPATQPQTWGRRSGLNLACRGWTRAWATPGPGLDLQAFLHVFYFCHFFKIDSRLKSQTGTGGAEIFLVLSLPFL